MRVFLSAIVAVAALQGGAALAADMPVKAPVVPPAVASWTGFYVGINGGVGWGDRSARWSSGDTAGTTFLNIAFLSLLNGPDRSYDQRPDAVGVLGGLQAGYNQQWGRFLVGFEADIQASGIKGSEATTGALGGSAITARTEQQLDWFGTARGRVGMLLWDQRILAYATGGLAFGHTEVTGDASMSNPFFIGAPPSDFNCPTAGLCISGSRSKTAAGWTAGGGAEMIVAGNVRLKVEYLHIDLGSESFRVVPVPPASGGGVINLRFNNSFDVVRAGLNFGF